MKILARYLLVLCILVARSTAMSAEHSPAFVDEFPLKISLGIRDDSYLPAAHRIAFPLAFRMENVGTVVVPAERVSGFFGLGVIHALSTDGNEQEADVQKQWRTRVNDLQPGLTTEASVYGNLLAFFPSLLDGDYQVWWTLDKFKSGVLHFTVADHKVQLQQPKT